jgi:hypothetical protein
VIDVDVIVLGESKIKDGGRIDPAMPLTAMRDDIVASFGLGDPEDWIIAVRPKDIRIPLESYHPTSGDTIYLLKASESRGVAFERRREAD